MDTASITFSLIDVETNRFYDRLYISPAYTLPFGIGGNLVVQNSVVLQLTSAIPTASIDLIPGIYEILCTGHSSNTKFFIDILNTGSYNAGDLIVNYVSASNFGTASYANNALSASYAVTASYAINASGGSTNINGVGSPVGVLIPAFINQFYSDYVNSTLWQGYGTSSNLEWLQFI